MLLDYEAMFDATPTPYLVGRHLFAAFPDPPEDQTASGVSNLTASLERVLATKRPDTMPVQRYDLADPVTGAYTERWWSPINMPVLDDDGEVVLLLHRVTEVTEWMLTRARQQQAETPTFSEADSDLYARAQELHAVWMQASADVENFREAMLSQRMIGQAIGLLMAKLDTDAEWAYALLVQESQYRNIKVREIVQEVISRHGGQPAKPETDRPFHP